MPPFLLGTVVARGGSVSGHSCPTHCEQCLCCLPVPGHPDGDSRAFAELWCCLWLLSKSEGQHQWVQLQKNSLKIKTFVV